jgi:4-hydroxybenzoate polyprenyltransferase
VPETASFDARRHGPVLSLALSTHPGPAIAVTVVAVLLGVGVGLDPWRLVLLGLAFLFDQASVGLSNDWIDAERDAAVGRQDKPVALGWIAASTVRTAAFGCAAIAILLTIPLGIWATIAHVVFIGSAWAYNAGLKSSILSVLPYLVSFGLLPLVVTLSLEDPAIAAPWAIGLGSLLGAAAHFANVLPDLDDDRATGVRGLPHRLGGRITGITTYLLLAAAAVLALLGPGGRIGVIQWIGFSVTSVIAVTGIVLTLSRPPRRLLFQLIIAATLIDVGMLLVAGQRLLA